MIYYIAQFFGILGLIIYIFGLFQKNKNKMLLYIVFNEIFFAVQYLLLGAYSGMFSNLFGIGRTYVFKQKEKYEYLNKIYVLMFFVIGYIIIGIISFDGNYINLLPILAEIIYVFSLWQKSVSKIRIGTLVMLILWLIYDLIVKAYPSVIGDIVVLIFTATAIITKDISLKRENMIK